MTSKFDLNRRQFIGGTLGVSALPLISKPVFAQAKTKLQFQCFGGAYEEILRQDIIPEFEAAHNIEVVFTVEDDVQMLPKLIAARDRPVYDVVTLDNPIAFQGKDLWLDNMTSKMPNAKDVYSSSLPPETAVPLYCRNAARRQRDRPQARDRGHQELEEIQGLQERVGRSKPVPAAGGRRRIVLQSPWPTTDRLRPQSWPGNAEGRSMGPADRLPDSKDLPKRRRRYRLGKQRA